MFPPSAEVPGVKVAKELCILSKEHAVSEKGKEKMNEENKRLKGGEKQAHKNLYQVFFLSNFKTMPQQQQRLFPL